jgi:hypothetical protein
MVKNVLIGKNTAGGGALAGATAWFVGSRFILPEATWLTAPFRQQINR